MLEQKIKLYINTDEDIIKDDIKGGPGGNKNPSSGMYKNFCEVHEIYPGVKRNPQTEFEELKNHYDWTQVIIHLHQQLSEQISTKNKLPPDSFQRAWTSMQSWIKQRRWEDMIPVKMDAKVVAQRKKTTRDREPLLDEVVAMLGRQGIKKKFQDELTDTDANLISDYFRNQRTKDHDKIHSEQTGER